MNNYIHLHVHSDYSSKDGAQSCKQIAEKASNLGMNAVALTDHGCCGGLLKFKKACQEADIKPIYGLEAYVAPESRLVKAKLDNHTKTSYHLTLLAKNEAGLRNLFRLTSISWLEGFYYKPRIDHELLEKHKEGLVVLSGCPSGRLPQFLMDGRMAEAREHAKYLRNLFGDDFYIEVQNHDFDWERPLKEVLFDISDILDIPIVATQDSHYQSREDHEVHSAICKLAAGDLEFGTDQLYFKSRSEMEGMFEKSEYHALDISQEIADKCNCNWQHDKTIWPVFKLPDGETPAGTLRRLAKEGFTKLFGEGTKEYRDRLEYELEVIEKMDFPTYFLVVADFVNWAKSKDIPVGVGRGSAAGCIVCYCLGITGIDPIKYGLYFERFLNPHRVSLPDIDLDFSKARRSEVFQYVQQKYGEDKVAQIGTYTMFKPRGSLRDFARVLGYEKSVGDKLASMIPPDDAGKALSFDEVIKQEPAILKTDWPKVVEFAQKAEDLNKQAGIHAAGVIISDIALSSHLPLFQGKNGEVVSQFDMHDVEDVGLVKYDFLGLKNLTVIQEAIKLIKVHHRLDIDITKIDDTDQKVFTETFQQGNLDGIFQFETSAGFKDLCIKVKPKSIEDLAIITSLFRPGPLTAKLTDEYVKRRNGGKVTYLSDSLRPALQSTFGILCFQEQIMRLCTEVAGYSLAEADNMRKIIGKKLRDKMELERKKFISGCVAADNDINEATANKLFDDIAGFAKYSFNLSHAVAYSVLSFQTAWLKTYYPVEFHTALLNSSFDDQEDLVKYIYACKDADIPIQPPDINTSGAMFTINYGTIIFGLAGIKGLGEKGCQALVEERNKNGEFKSLQDLVGRKINKGSIKALAACGALEGISDLPREQLVDNLEGLFKYYDKLSKWKERLQRIKEREKEIQEWNANPIGTKPRRLPQPKENSEPKIPEIVESDITDKPSRLSLERQTLGFYLTGHPMDEYPGLSRLAKYDIAEIKEGKNITSGTPIMLPAVVSAIRDIRTKSGAKMAAVNIEDKSGRMEATIFPKQWRYIEPNLQEDTVNIVKGTVQVVESDSSDSPPIVKVIINDLQLVKEDSAEGQIHPIQITLRDKTTVKFTPLEDVNYQAYQQALAIASNLQRMR